MNSSSSFRMMRRAFFRAQNQNLLPVSPFAFHVHQRYLAIFRKGNKHKEDETPMGTKIKDVARVQNYFDEQSEMHGNNSENFLNTVQDFKNLKKLKRFGYAEFVQVALPAMEAFGVHKDLESYRALLKVFPVGAFVPSSKIAAGFYPHYVQQRAAIEILSKMEKYNIMPDKQMEQYIIASFGEYSEVWRKVARLNYWMTKFKNANPYPFPEVIPEDPLELAVIALKRMSPDPQSDVFVHSAAQSGGDNVEDSWVVYSQSETQCEIIEEIAGDEEKMKNLRISLDGPFDVWVRDKLISYFVLYCRDLSPKKAGNTVDKLVEDDHENNGEFFELFLLQIVSFFL